MMGRRLPTRSGGERDAVTRWSAKYLDKSGVRHRIKRGMRRRERHEAALWTQAEIDSIAERAHEFDELFR